MTSNVVLITGGSGFLGRSLAVSLRERGHRVVLGARNNAHNARAERATGCESVPLDVASIESVRDALAEFRPGIVVHAAATKFVDLSERQPMECIDVNVLGSQNVVRACIERGVSLLVGVSTDKAAPPAGNLYGLSKAAMERMLCSMNGRGGLTTTCVRFGNIAWSTGSVLPIWKRMHEESGVIGSTGPDMRRFFFTVEEASELVLRAIDHAPTVAGKVLSVEMKAAQVRQLLDVWTKVRGGRWERIEERPGDKIDEHLIGSTELGHTSRVVLDDKPHFLIDFANKADSPVEEVSTATAAAMSEEEIRRLLDAEPASEAP